MSLFSTARCVAVSRSFVMSRKSPAMWRCPADTSGSAGRRTTPGLVATRRRGWTACGIERDVRGPAPMPPAPRSSTRSSTCAATTTSAPARSRCTCGATTTSRSASRGYGGSCTGWTWGDCRPRSAISATTGAGPVMRSSAQDITSRSTSSSSNPCRPGPLPGRPLDRYPPRRWAVAASSTSSPPSTTAPDYGSCGSTRATTKRPPSSSLTTCSPNCPSRSRRSKPTTVPNFSPRSIGTCSTRASTTSTSSREHPG